MKRCWKVAHTVIAVNQHQFHYYRPSLRNQIPYVGEENTYETLSSYTFVTPSCFSTALIAAWGTATPPIVAVMRALRVWK